MRSKIHPRGLITVSESPMSAAERSWRTIPPAGANRDPNTYCPEITGEVTCGSYSCGGAVPSENHRWLISSIHVSRPPDIEDSETVISPRGWIFDRIVTDGGVAAWQGGDRGPNPGDPAVYGAYLFDGAQARLIGESSMLYSRSIDVADGRVAYVGPLGADTFLFDIGSGTTRSLGIRAENLVLSGDHLLYSHRDSGLNLYDLATGQTLHLSDIGSGYADIEGNLAAWTEAGGIALYDIAAGTKSIVGPPGSYDPKLSGIYLSWQREGDLYLTTIPEPAGAAALIAAAAMLPVRHGRRRRSVA